jgi:hypothetical protein
MNRFIKIAGFAVAASALVGASFAFAQDASSIAPSSTPATTPVHNQQIQVSSDLQIGPKGAFLGHGIVVQSINGDSFTGTVWGVTYTVNVNTATSSSATARPEFLLKNGNDGGPFDASQVQIGDQMGVSGWVASSSPLIVNAQVVRDYSIAVSRPQPMANASETPESNFRRLPYNPSSSINIVNMPENQSGTATSTGTSTASMFNQLNDLLKQIQGLQNIFNTGNSGK